MPSESSPVPAWLEQTALINPNKELIHLCYNLSAEPETQESFITQVRDLATAFSSLPPEDSFSQHAFDLLQITAAAARQYPNLRETHQKATFIIASNPSLTSDQVDTFVATVADEEASPNELRKRVNQVDLDHPRKTVLYHSILRVYKQIIREVINYDPEAAINAAISIAGDPSWQTPERTQLFELVVTDSNVVRIIQKINSEIPNPIQRAQLIQAIAFITTLYH